MFVFILNTVSCIYFRSVEEVPVTDKSALLLLFTFGSPPAATWKEFSSKLGMSTATNAYLC